MDLGLHSISTQDICKLYDVTSRTVHRWITAGDDPAPRLRSDRDHYFALADLLPRVPRDPAPLLRLDGQRRPHTPPDVDLGHEMAIRARLLWKALSDAQRQRLGQIQSGFRETIARALWEKVIFLEPAYLTQALSLHCMVQA